MFYEHHLTFAHMEGDKVISTTPTMPYALLMLDISGEFPKAMFAVVRRLDFQHLFTLEEESFLNKEIYRVVIMYKPATGFKKIFAGILPTLEYQVFKFDTESEWMNNQILYAFDQTWLTNPDDFL